MKMVIDGGVKQKVIGVDWIRSVLMIRKSRLFSQMVSEEICRVVNCLKYDLTLKIGCMYAQYRVLTTLMF